MQTDPYKEALKLFNNKQYKSSIEICSKELNKLDVKESLFTKFLFLRTSSYTELRDYKSGIADYLTLIKLHPAKIDYYSGLAYLYGETKEYENSLDVLNKGFKINPKNIYLLNNLSYYSNEIEKFEDGLMFANKALSLTNDPYWKGALLNNRGYSNIGLKKYDLALNDINEAIKFNPDNPFAYCYRAIANIKLKHFGQVCEDLNKAKRLGAIELTGELIKQYCKN